MPVVVKVTNDRRGPALGVQLFNDGRHSPGGVIVVDRDADQLGTGARQRGDLLDRGLDVRRVGVGHRLHDDGCVGADADLAYGNGDSSSALDSGHTFIV